MSEYGILFSAPMVRALLNTKVGEIAPIDPTKPYKAVTRRLDLTWLKKAKKGNVLWVRETWGIGGAVLIDPCLNFRADGAQSPLFQVKPGWWRRAPEAFGVVSSEELLKVRNGWRPSLFMPRWASRIQLEVLEDTRAERLQDITEEEARLEGVESCCGGTRFRSYGKAPHAAINHYADPRASFETLWQSLHTKPGERWEDNPRLARIGLFRRIQ